MHRNSTRGDQLQREKKEEEDRMLLEIPLSSGAGPLFHGRVLTIRELSLHGTGNLPGFMGKLRGTRPLAVNELSQFRVLRFGCLSKQQRCGREQDAEGNCPNSGSPRNVLHFHKRKFHPFPAYKSCPNKKQVCRAFLRRSAHHQ